MTVCLCKTLKSPDSLACVFLHAVNRVHDLQFAGLGGRNPRVGPSTPPRLAFRIFWVKEQDGSLHISRTPFFWHESLSVQTSAESKRMPQVRESAALTDRKGQYIVNVPEGASASLHLKLPENVFKRKTSSGNAQRPAS